MTARTEDLGTVRTSILVNANATRAFEVFTTGMDTWWPRTHHVQGGELKEIGVEPRAGGRLREENDAGDVCTWGRVLRWEPPRVLAFSWLIGKDFDVPDPGAVGSPVTVTFTPNDSGTLVELVHARLEAHGSEWEQVRDAVGSDNGWLIGLRQFAAASSA